MGLSDPDTFQIKVKSLKAKRSSPPSAANVPPHSQPACPFLQHLILAHARLHHKTLDFQSTIKLTRALRQIAIETRQ